MSENETKGKSIINPITFKNDMLSQAWLDSRVVATLDLWLEKNEIYCRSLTEVVRLPLEILVNELVERGEVEMVSDTNLARGRLARKYKTKLNRGGKGGKNILHNMVLSSKDIYPKIEVEELTSSDIDRAIDIYRKIEQEQLEAQKKAQLENATVKKVDE